MRLKTHVLLIINNQNNIYLNATTSEQDTQHKNMQQTQYPTCPVERRTLTVRKQ